LKPKGYIVALIYLIGSMIGMHSDMLSYYQGAMLIGLGLVLGVTNSILDHVEEMNEKVD